MPGDGRATRRRAGSKSALGQKRTFLEGIRGVQSAIIAENFYARRAQRTAAVRDHSAGCTAKHCTFAGKNSQVAIFGTITRNTPDISHRTGFTASLQDRLADIITVELAVPSGVSSGSMAPEGANRMPLSRAGVWARVPAARRRGASARIDCTLSQRSREMIAVCWPGYRLPRCRIRPM